jgi:hypothetical protein
LICHAPKLLYWEPKLLRLAAKLRHWAQSYVVGRQNLHVGHCHALLGLLNQNCIVGQKTCSDGHRCCIRRQ